MKNNNRYFSGSVSRLHQALNVFCLFSTAFSIVILLSFLGLVSIYGTHLYITEHTDGYVAAVSWIVQQGKPLYHSLEAPQRYSTLYGPSLFLVVGFFMRLFEPSLIIAKLPTIISLVFNLVLLFLVLKNKVNYPLSVLGTAYGSLAILAFGNTVLNVAFQIRSDSLILFCVTLSLWGVVTQKRGLACLICALGFGFAVNLKVTSVLYFLPVYAMLLSQSGLSATLISLLLGTLVIILPFLLPQISLTQYLLWIDRTANHGLSLQLLRENFQTALILLLPLVLTLLQLRIVNLSSFQRFIASNYIYLSVLLLGIFGTSIVAAKPGSGSHHVLPYIPIVVYFCILIIVEIKIYFVKNQNQIFRLYSAKTIFLIFLALIFSGLLSINAVWKGVFLLSNIRSDSASSIVADIEQVTQSYPERTIEMGYGNSSNYFLTDYRPIPVFAGHPYFLDSTALMDMQKAGLDLPNSTLDIFRSCRVEIWLIPKGDDPFSLLSYYDPNPPLFSDRFKAIFRQNYEIRDRSQYYDLWFCKQK